MKTKKPGVRRNKKEIADHMHVNHRRSFRSEMAPCINPDFMDEKYIASRKVGDYYYSIYVKEARPMVRDAMIFLNFAYHSRERLFDEVQGKAEEREYMKIAMQKLLSYADENIGAFKLFFTKTNKTYPLTSVIMRPQMWREEFSLDLLMELIDEYTDEKLFTMLMMYLHKKQVMNKDFVSKIIANRDLLILFLDGALYESHIKTNLLELYDMTSLSEKNNPSLKVLFKNFILDFYNKYEEVFAYAQKAINKEVAEFVKSIKKYGELPGVTDNFVFRRVLIRNAKEKSVCVEFLPFCKANVEYFASYNAIVICVGNGIITLPGSLSDSERVGEKLRLLNSSQLYKIMKSIFAKPTNLATVATELGVSPDRAYRILSQLVEERYILKAEDNQTYTANKEHFTKIIQLLESFGGED